MKTTKVLLLLIIFISSSMVRAQKITDFNDYQLNLIFDKKFSAYTGSSLATSTMELYNYLLPAESTNHYLKILADIIVASEMEVINHEIFGHGARLREFNVPGRHYHIGFLEGFAEYDDTQSNLHVQKDLAISFGGVEASKILSSQIKSSWLEQRRINYNQSWLEFFTSTEQAFYIQFADHDTDGNDMSFYISKLNEWYGKTVLTQGKLSTYAFLDYLDPFLYYNLFTIYNYAAHNDTSFEYPMIELTENLCYLPGMKLVLTPYGIEPQLVNYISYKQTPIIVSLNYGSNNKQRSYGITFESNKLVSFNNTDIGSKISLWIQPELLKNKASEAHLKPGCLITLKFTQHLTKQLTALLHLGYKTKGFVQGEPLNKSAIVRLGIGYSFR